jgi:hypothetical protein
VCGALRLILLVSFEIGAPVVESREQGSKRSDNQQNRKEKRGYTEKDYDKADCSNGKMCN